MEVAHSEKPTRAMRLRVKGYIFQRSQKRGLAGRCVQLPHPLGGRTPPPPGRSLASSRGSSSRGNGVLGAGRHHTLPPRHARTSVQLWSPTSTRVSILPLLFAHTLRALSLTPTGSPNLRPSDRLSDADRSSRRPRGGRLGPMRRHPLRTPVPGRPLYFSPGYRSGVPTPPPPVP